MKDFILYRHMLTPVLLQILFWLAVVACIYTGIYDIAHSEIYRGIEILLIGPILARIASEILILFFRINATLTEICHNTHRYSANKD